MTQTGFQVGDWVIYRKSKQSLKPGSRAQDVQPFQKGDGYSYTVDKFWVVDEVCPDGSLVLITRRGKRNRVRRDDPALRKPNWWQRFRYRARFEEIIDGRNAET